MQTQMPGSLPDYQIDPYRLVEDDIKDMFDEIQLVRLFLFLFYSKIWFTPPELVLFFSLEKLNV